MTVEEWLGKDNQLGCDIWHKKYQFNNESFEEWLDRVSGGNKELRQLIKEKKFLFGGRILANRGLNKHGKKISLSNCYVMSQPEDNLDSIFECTKELAKTYSRGGGCGVDLGRLRPRNSRVNNAAEKSSGAVSFMDLYSLVTDVISQNGRRGALMLSMPCDHPDIEEFINIKNDLSKVTKANISIRVTDDFMEAVQNKKDFTLSFVVDSTGETITKTINAYDFFHQLCKNNWDYAEPGILFWSQIEDWNILSEDQSVCYSGVNPCAEEPLIAGGSCLLGSINLSEFVHNKKFDFGDFERSVEISIMALNEVLDEGIDLHPLQIQRDNARDWRQIGLGIMGLGDMLIQMEMEYGTEESLRICDLIGFTLANKALKTSSELAKYRGAYPKYHIKEVLSSHWIQMNSTDDTIDSINTYGLANSQLLTTAPTGSLSSMLGVTGGIEPVFANSYTRKTESLHGHDEYYKVYTPIVKAYMDAHNITDEEDLPDYFRTAHDIPYRERIDMQAIWQKHIDASISSTINLPNSATIKDVENLYLYAWRKRLKGVTIFRDGCKRLGILTNEPKDKNSTNKNKNNTDKISSKTTDVDTNNNSINTYKNKNENDVDKILPRGMIIKADDNSIGKKRTLHTGCGTLHIEAFFDPADGSLLETYFSKGSTGGCNNFMIGLSRMISLSARGGVDIYSIVDQLKSSGACPSYAVRTALHHDTSKGSCCPVAIGNALLNMYTEMQEEINDNEVPLEPLKQDAKPQKPNIENLSIVNQCPVCGAELSFTGGCYQCFQCGYSKCE